MNTSNLYNLTKYNVLIPNSGFWYDGANTLYCYDLYIEKYCPSIDLGSGYLARAFRISTLVPAANWKTGNNLYMNNTYLNYPETLTVYMNNNSNVCIRFIISK